MSKVLPILFNTEMVLAILDGRKTVTRRLIKPQQLIGILPDKCKNGTTEEFLKEKKYMFKPYCDMTDAELISTSYKPQYQPGDILYVRETFDYLEGWKIGDPGIEGKYFYRADGDLRPVSWRGKWHPSLHMPKEAARIFLKVKDVRAERLQEINGKDVLKEGVNSLVHPDASYFDMNQREMFEELWNSTIKKSELEHYGWDADPWVWVISFERCEKPENW